MTLLAENPLALVVTADGAAPQATHAPVLFHHGPAGVDEAGVVDGAIPLVGSVLVGHMNIDNPQWRSMHDGDQALVIFHGPHAYVSPSVYGLTPAAPTWDFTAVHFTGTLVPFADSEQVLELVCNTARRLEGAFGQGWNHEPSTEYFRQIAGGVGAFELRVESVKTMFKLSQEQPRKVRRKVANHFESSTSPMHQRLAALMQDNSNTDIEDAVD